MQIRSAGLVLLISLWCSSAMAQPDIRLSPDLGVLTSAQRSAIAAASEVMREFMLTFNAQDPDRWAQTLLFPHVRISSGGVVIHPSREEFVAQMDFQAFARNYNWQRSAWDRLEVIQVGPNKVHIAVQFTRYDAEQNPQASFDSLYVLQRNAAGRWGIRARSSFAP
jgi:hypothetical protein